MQRMNEYDFLRRLNKEEAQRIGSEHHSPPFVVMIAEQKGKSHEAYAKSLGLSDYIRTPHCAELIVEAVERCTKPE